MLPDEIEWPRGVNPEKRDAGEVPLHFIAQIACADLPPGLWGGLGPRSGWLRLFQNNNTCDSEDRGVWRLIHTEELGSERQPPTDIGVIHDGMYTGGSRWTETRTTYPRWPVDLVKLGNTLRHEGQRSWPTPDQFETVLYPGKPVQTDAHQLPKLPIFSRRILDQALRDTIALLRRELQHTPISDAARSRLATPENWELIRSARAAPLDLLSAHPNAESLLARCEADRAAWLEWRTEVADWLEEWLGTLEPAGLDQPLTKADQARLDLLAEAPPQIQWFIDHHIGYPGHPEHVGPRKSEHSAFKLLTERAHRPARDVMGEYYLDPARRSLLPAEHLPTFEAWWRSLYSNRPHRMGGYHDGVQSDAIEGPQSKLLVLQLATDDAMQFCWGDCGAVYAFIRPDDLAAGNFDAAEFHLECH